MRTVIFLICGVLAWGFCLGAARLLAGAGSASLSQATMIFIACWLVVAGINMGLGIFKAGYSFSEEFPIFLLIFAVPALLAIFVKWKWLDVLTPR
jgi:hypothetical protein